MNSKKVLTWVVVGLGLLMVVYTFVNQQPEDLLTVITQHRQEINDFMSGDEESPLVDSVKTNFSGLNYFDVDARFKVRARLDKIDNRETITMGTSDGKQVNYRRYAWAHFEISDTPLRLLLLRSLDPEDNDYLFLPFGDLTNGNDTYGGGRYLDLDLPRGNSLEIDFNKAYSPYCAYNQSYSCPLPPSENRLPLSIRAGEKNFP